MTTGREAKGDAVRSANAVATATLVAGPGTLKGLYFICTAAGGTITLRDGGGTGAVLAIFNVALVADNKFIPLPGAGIEFGTDLHATLTAAVTGITVFFA